MLTANSNNDRAISALLMTGKSESAIDEEDDSSGINRANIGGGCGSTGGDNNFGSGLKRSRSINQSCVNLKRNFAERDNNCGSSQLQLSQMKSFDSVEMPAFTNRYGMGSVMATSRNIMAHKGSQNNKGGSYYLK